MCGPGIGRLNRSGPGIMCEPGIGWTMITRPDISGQEIGETGSVDQGLVEWWSLYPWSVNKRLVEHGSLDQELCGLEIGWTVITGPWRSVDEGGVDHWSVDPRTNGPGICGPGIGGSWMGDPGINGPWIGRSGNQWTRNCWTRDLWTRKQSRNPWCSGARISGTGISGLEIAGTGISGPGIGFLDHNLVWKWLPQLIKLTEMLVKTLYLNNLIRYICEP